MAIKSSTKDGIFNEINITPLTDIFLVLLIIMMVMAPMFQSNNKNINIPEINSGLNIDNKLTTVAVDKNGTFFINTRQIRPDQLENELAANLSTSKEKSIVVQADAMTKNSQIMKIVRAAQVTGYEKLTVAGEPLSKKQQTELEQKNPANSAGKSTKSPLNLPE